MSTLRRLLFVNTPSLPRETRNRVEIITLSVSLFGSALVAFGRIGYGMYINSDVIIMNGVYSLVAFAGTSLNLLGAKLVKRRENERFQYGYSHLEPLIHSLNALVLAVLCIYAFLNSIEGIRNGGHVVDAAQVILGNVIICVICGGLWVYEVVIGKRIGSQFVQNDSKERLKEFAMSLVAIIGFTVLFYLEEPYRGVWERYADNVMVAVTALLLFPLPLRVLMRNIPEVLRMTNPNDALVEVIDAAMEAVKKEYPITKYSSYVVKVGKNYFVDIIILVDQNFPEQSVAWQDAIRERIWRASGKHPDELWLTLSMTANSRWI